MTPALAVLDPKAVEQILAQDLPGWALRDGALERTITTPGWPYTLMVVNAIGYLAEAACHHPELRVTYPRVVVRLNTHEPPGITTKDIELARLMERVIHWQPGPGETLEGFARGYGKPWLR